MVRRARLPPSEWPAWFHSPTGESAVFSSAEEVPQGWTSNTIKIYEAPPDEVYDHDELVAELESRGIEVLGYWSDAYMKELLG